MTVNASNMPCIAGIKFTYIHNDDINNVSVSDVKILHKGKGVSFYKDRWACESYINLMNSLGQLEDRISIIVQ